MPCPRQTKERFPQGWSPSRHDALSNCEYKKSGSDNVISTSEKFHGEQGRGHHQTHTVYAPRSRLKVSLRDDGPNHAKHSAQSETNTSHDVQWVFHIGRSSYSTDQVGRVASDDDVKRA